MYFLLYLILLVVVYVVSFKSDFTEEKVKKITPILVGSTFIIFVLNILSSLISK